jgi:hypothetical protein
MVKVNDRTVAVMGGPTPEGTSRKVDHPRVTVMRPVEGRVAGPKAKPLTERLRN